jgi:hypothetical protein
MIDRTTHFEGSRELNHPSAPNDNDANGAQNRKRQMQQKHDDDKQL